MTDHTIKSSRHILEEDRIDDQFAFKTTSFIQNDLQLSLIYFGLILFSPLLLWSQVDHALLFSWQGGMLAITTARWVCRFATESKISKENLSGFWSGVLVFLTLLEGLGWGISGAILFPINSTLTMSLIALLLVGVGGVGAAAYSSRMLIAIPYLLCVITPYISRLYFTGGNDAFLIASVLCLVAVMFCFATDRLNITLTSALKSKSSTGVKEQDLKEQNQHLENLLGSEKLHTKNLEDQLVNNSHELANVHEVMTEYSNELHLLSGRSINLLSDLGRLKSTDLNQDQATLISRIEENALHLSKILSDGSDVQESFSDAPEVEATLSVDATDEQKEKIESIVEIIDDVIPKGIKASSLAIDISSDTQKVLIVGDNKNEREAIEACMREIDLSYKSVENAPTALAVLCEAQANDNSFDIVIANMWMPDMDGIGFAECLQDDPEFKGIKFILINSGEMPPENLLQKVGINRIVQKPIQTDDLIKIVSALIQEPVATSLPSSIESVIDDAIQFSLNNPDYEEASNTSEVIDTSIIESLRSSTTTNFIEAVNDFLEDAPELIENVKATCTNRDYTGIKKSVNELAERSLDMGAISLLESAKSIEDALDNDQIDRIMRKLQTIDAEFIQVESALLAELTNGSLLFNEIKH